MVGLSFIQSGVLYRGSRGGWRTILRVDGDIVVYEDRQTKTEHECRTESFRRWAIERIPPLSSR